MVRCPTEVELSRYLEGALPANEARVIEEHGTACADCRDRLAGEGEDSLLLDVRRVAKQPQVPAVTADWFDGATGEALSRYEVLGRIGSGGMGVVYEAEQKNPRRRVAIKVVKSMLMSPGLERRFAREVDALARLEHRGIARVLEADTFEAHGEKRPFFAMELVDGLPLDDYVASKELSRRARLELFLEICDAMAHAHQKGVLHRDLKPSNILVTDDGQPKILDFGLARSTESESLHTQDGQLVGTLPYMSPEQVGGDHEAIDTRSDVYALGLILYRLLAERMPYEIEGKSAADIVRIVSSVEPRRLRTLDMRVPRDLDTIAAKALEKDRERRYRSVDALAEDVRRYLGDEPIAARPPGKLYQVGKFTRRNKGVVAGLALAFLVLIGGVVVSTNQARRARAAEAEARREARTEGRVNEFLSHLLGSDMALEEERPVDFTVRQALDGAETWIEKDLAEEPLVEATVRVMVGNLYVDQDRHAEALRHLHRAVELREEVLGRNDRKTGAAINALGAAYYASGDPEQAELHLRRSLGIYALEPDDPEVQKWRGTTHLNLATMALFAEDFDEAQVEIEQAIELHRTSMGARDPQLARDLQILAGIKQGQGLEEEMFDCLREAVAIYRGSENPRTEGAAKVLTYLANELRDDMQLDEAIELHLEALDILVFLKGAESPEVGDMHKLLSVAFLWKGELDEALDHAEEAIVLLRDAGERKQYATAVNYLGHILRDMGEVEAALDAFYEARDLRLELLGAEDPLTREVQRRITECEEQLAAAQLSGG